MSEKIKEYAMNLLIGMGLGIIAALPVIQRIVENVTR